MKTPRKGFIIPLLLAFVALLLAGGAYVYLQPVSQASQPVVGDLPTATAISNFQFRLATQQKSGTIQTGDVIEFTWNGCKLPKSDISLQLGYPSYGSGEKTKSILIADNIQDTNTYLWKIPTTIESGEYEVYIATNVCNSGVFSKEMVKIRQSVKPFVTFIAPRESETIQSGTTYEILWESSLDPNTKIDIGYRSSTVGNQNYIHWITEKVKDVKNIGNYNWMVPANIAKSGWMEILIRNAETGEQVASGAFLVN